MLVREVQPATIPLASVNAPKPSHEAGMLSREVQPATILVELVNAPKPAHELGILVKAQRKNI